MFKLSKVVFNKFYDDEENNIISCVRNQEDQENEILGNDAALEEEM